MTSLLRDLRYSLRALGKSPGFTAVALATLAVGIGSSTAIFSVVHAALLRPLPFAKSEGILTLWHSNIRKGVERDEVSAADFLDWKERNRVFASMAAAEPYGFDLIGQGEPETIPAWLVTREFFDILGVRPQMGRLFSPGEYAHGGEGVVLLGHGLWKARFGADPAVVGRTLSLDGKPLVVVGILPEGFQFPPGRELWAPRPLDDRDRTNARGDVFTVIARLRPGVSVPRAQAEMDGIAAQLARERPRPGDGRAGRTATVEPLREQMVSRARPALALMTAAVGLVLLMACANLSSLVLTRLAGRRRELAVRAALGASRGRLLRQLFTETLLVGVLGGMLGLFLSIAAQGPLASAAGNAFPRGDEAAARPGVVLFTLTLSLACGLLVGVAPALRANRPDVEAVLREESPSAGGSRAGARLRAALVVGQVALALVLCAGAALLLRSLERLETVRPGLDPQRVLVARFTIPASRYPERDQYLAVYRRILERVEATPGVAAAGAIKVLPVRGWDEPIGFRVAGRPAPPGGQWIADVYPVSPGYFRAVGLPLVAGRGFTDADDARAVPVAALSQSAARAFFPGESPIEKTIETSGTSVRIVGIVPDERGGALRAPRPTFYLPQSQAPRRIVTLVARGAAGDARALAGPVRRAIASVDPNIAVAEIGPLEDMLATTLASPRLLARLLAAFGAGALLLAVLGLYGLLSETVAARRRELALRLALGARPEALVRAVLTQASRAVAAGVFLGILGALAASGLLRGLLFEVSPTDPATLAGATAVLAVAALLAAYVPARRASRVDPMEALRGE